MDLKEKTELVNKGTFSLGPYSKHFPRSQYELMCLQMHENSKIIINWSAAITLGVIISLARKQFLNSATIVRIHDGSKIICQ